MEERWRDGGDVKKESGEVLRNVARKIYCTFLT